MLFKPRNEKLWDTWIVPHNNKYYLFYLRVSSRSERWDGVSLAISDDLLHWKWYGEVLNKSDEALWLGTGMVVEKEGEFIMNYSEECPKGSQHIKFARSKDLLHWEKLPEESWPDGNYYVSDNATSCYPLYRWDSLGVFTVNKKYYAFLTASNNRSEVKGRVGALGLVCSNDLLNWQCLPCPAVSPEDYPNYEVPEYVSFGERHYAIFSTNSKAGFRFDDCEGQCGGVYYLCSDDPLKGYRKPSCDNMLLGVRNVFNVYTLAVGRTIVDFKGRRILYHHWGSQDIDGISGIPKLLVEKRPYELELRYMPEVDTLKGKKINIVSAVLAKCNGMLPPIDYAIDGSSVFFTPTGTSGTVDFELDDISANGLIVEFEMTATCGCVGICYDSNDPIGVFFDYRIDKIEFSTIHDGWECNLFEMPQLVVSHKSFGGEKYRVRIFSRLNCFEVYIDDVYVAAYRHEFDVKYRRLSLFAENTDARIEKMKVFRFEV